MIIKITRDECYNHCRQEENGALWLCPKGDKDFKIGPYFFEREKYGFVCPILLMPGERFLAGEVKNTLEPIYIDYPDITRRIYIDRDFYVGTMNIMRVLKIKSIKLFDIEFRFFDWGLFNEEFGQMISKDSFEIRERKKQPIMTKGGLRMINIFSYCEIRFGECRVCVTDGTALCYGDPE